MYTPSKELINNELERSGIFDATAQGNKQSFSFRVPKELYYISAISPEAFAVYFPRWLEKEFARRVSGKVVVTKLTWEVSTESFLEEPDEIYMTVSGEGIVKEDF